MTGIRHYCDHCKGRIESDRTWIVIRCGPLRSHLGSLDLCGSCADALGSWLACEQVDGRNPSGAARTV
jgi:hypothetical protein